MNRERETQLSLRWGKLVVEAKGLTSLVSLGVVLLLLTVGVFFTSSETSKLGGTIVAVLWAVFGGLYGMLAAYFAIRRKGER